MLYCFIDKYIEGKQKYNDEINLAISKKSFIYYNEDTNSFMDENDNIVDVKDKEVFPVVFANSIYNVLDALKSHGAITCNSSSDIKKILDWIEYINPKRMVIPFDGKLLNDQIFLDSLNRAFPNQKELFLKTYKKDFNGIIKKEDLFDTNSDLRKAFSYHENDKFMLSNKVDIDKDTIGRIEYRAFIYKGNIMNISRITDKIYHKIPKEVLEFIKDVIDKLPSDFPATFALDIFSYNNKLDILEFNPLEASGRYLYNSIFVFDDDITHENITKVPEEKNTSDLSFDVKETMVPSTTKFIEGSFAKDYDDIKKYGDRVNGYVYIYGASDSKINLSDLMNNLSFVDSDASPSRSVEEILEELKEKKLTK